MPFLLIRNDITKVEADVIVNPANTQLLQGSGTSRAIYLAAGEEKLTAACKKIGCCDVGKSVITKAFDMPAKYIIHTVGPVWQDGAHQENEILYSAYKSALQLAAKRRAKSIAFPLLSSGNYGYPKELALKVAVSAISDFLLEHDMMVYMVLYDRKALAVSQKLFASIEEYIDDHYVDENNEFYHRNTPRDCYAQSCMVMESPSLFSGRKLEDLMKHMGETFSQMLLRLIDERGMKDSDVYHKANIDRRHFSKIRKNKDYAPNKKTAVALAIALELSLDETKDLLNAAGLAFSNSSKFDVIIQFFLENEIYDVFEINEMLFAYEQPLIGE